MSKLTNVAIPLLSAILAFFGAVAGSYVAGDLQENLWFKQADYEQRKIILAERVRIIDRISKITNSAQHAKILQEYLVAQAGIAQLNVDCLKVEENKLNRDQCFSNDSSSEVLDASKKQTELTAEFVSTLQLASLYFGKKTKQACNQYAKQTPWWNASPEYPKTLLNAMHSELHEYE